MQRSASATGVPPVLGHGQDGHGTVPAIVHDVLRSPGQPLDRSTRAFFEPHFGHDFSKVRVHADATAAESARAVNAAAYTVGRDVVFDSGRHAPNTREGRELLAHELTHVVQQHGAADSPAPALRLGSVNDPHEREADAAAKATMSGSAPGSVGHASGLIQRQAQNAPSTEEAVDPGFPSDRPVTPTPPAPTPKACAPPSNLGCPVDSGGAIGYATNITFPVNSALLGAAQRADLDSAAASWNTGGATQMMAVRGYASVEGDCESNWVLSCRRAHAAAEELQNPINGGKGIPATFLALSAHGESVEAGPAPESNRRVTVSSSGRGPVPAPKP